MNSAWSDAKKWRMDLLKSVLTFTIAAVVSLFVIDTIQANRAAEKARADAFYAARVNTLDEFRSAAVAYDLAAHSAYTDLYQWMSKKKTKAMLTYEQESYPTWVLSYETIEHLFPESSAKVNNLKTIASERHDVYDVLVDTRLDGDENTPIDPGSSRSKFNELSAELTAERAELLAILQKTLFPPLNRK